MKKKYKILIIVLVLAAAGKLAWKIKDISLESGNFIVSAIGLIVLGFTAFTIFKYTKATQESNDLKVRPVVNLYLRSKKMIPAQRERFAIRNIGQGTAYNIIIENIEIDEKTFKFPITDEPNIILEPLKDEKALGFQVRSKKEGVIGTDISYFKTIFSSGTLKPEVLEESGKKFATFLIRYKNIADKTFYSVFKFYTRHPITSEFVIEFIKSGEGKLTMEKAQKICQNREKIKSIYGR